MFLTEVTHQSIVESDVIVISTRKRCHTDGITWIDVIPKYRAYATSSYDCCSMIWSLDEDKKLGSLYLGGIDPNWIFKVDEDRRKEVELKHANSNLKKVHAAKKQQEEDKKKIKRKFESKDETLLHANSILNKVITF
jgi:RPA family protein